MHKDWDQVVVFSSYWEDDPCCTSNDQRGPCGYTFSWNHWHDSVEYGPDISANFAAERSSGVSVEFPWMTRFVQLVLCRVSYPVG